VKEYDKSQPLIVIHIPKSAGSTSQKIFQSWYGEKFLWHYFNELTGDLPQKYDLFDMHLTDKPILLHGHFNNSRGFGIYDYYPNVEQFITILRDPFELAISNYFYVRQVGSKWLDQSRIPKGNIEKYLLNTTINMLNHFPRKVTKENYREIIEKYFIEIGITEHLNESMKRIANKLNFNYDEKLLGHYNTTQRDQKVPDYLRDKFREKNQLEFTVYNYALQKFKQSN